MALSYNLGYQEIISVHPTRRQIFAGKPYSTFPNIWEWLIYFQYESEYENFAFLFVTKKNIYNSSCSYDNSDYDLLKIWIGSTLSKVGVLSGNGDGDWSWLGSVKFNRPISPYAPHCLHLWAGLGSNLFCSQPPIHCLPYWHLGLLRLVSQYD